MSSIHQIKWLNNMSIDEVSKEIGGLAAQMEQQTKLISKLFQKGEERDRKFDAFRDEFRTHVAEENGWRNKLNDLDKLQAANQPVIDYAQRCEEAHRRKMTMYRDLHKALLKWGLIGFAAGAVGWTFKHVIEDLQKMSVGG